MTIDEAIKLLTNWVDKRSATDPKKLDEAERLGIEALKRHQELSKSHPIRAWTPLPGETKD